MARQGQRTLSSIDSQDFGQEVVVPAGDLLLSFDAVLGRMLLEEPDREAA